MSEVTQQQKILLGCLVMFCAPFILIGLLLFSAHQKDLARNERLEQQFSSDRTISISTNALLREVSANEYATGNRYNDQVIEVTGTVLRKSLGSMSQIVYLGPEYGNWAVWCYFDESWNSRLADLRPGQQVRIRGIANIFAGVVLEKCRLI